MGNKVAHHRWKLERWQGPPHINKVKQYEVVLSFKASLFTQIIQSCKSSEFDYLKISISEDEDFFLELQSAPLTMNYPDERSTCSDSSPAESALTILSSTVI